MGASSGIGNEVSRLLIERGWTVGVAARRTDRLEQLRALAPDRVFTAGIDVTHDDAPALLRQLIAATGGMDLYFHVSGIGKQNPQLEEDIENNTLKTNGLGFTRMIGEAYRYFAEKGSGHIAAISSIAGTKGMGAAPSYSATKAFQNTYLQSLEQQAHMRKLPIRFTDIRPGFVDTALLDNTHYPLMMKPEFAAKKALQAIDHKRHICVIDWRWRIITAFWRRIPRWIWRRLNIK